MSTLAEFMIVAGADNCLPMLDKPQYESWKICMELYIQENGTVRPNTYEELSDKEKLQADCDLKATNIVLQGLPSDVYALVSHHKVSKDIWDRIKLLMQGTSLSKQEHECKLYDEFDKFSYVKGLAVLTFLPSDDLITCMNKAMTFLSAVFTTRYPSTNNQLRPSSNLRNQATVQDGSRGNTSGQVKVIKFYNCQGERHTARQYTQPKRRRDARRFKEKVLLVQAQAVGKELDEEQLAFIVDPGVEDAKAVLMANLLCCNSDVLSEDKANNERMFKLHSEPLAPKFLENKDAHLEYIKHSREHADILREIVKSARALSPLHSNLDSAYKFVQRIQEVLVYIRDTCPYLTRPSEKLVAVTPTNKDKKVRFSNPVTSSSNTQNSHDKCVLDYVHDVNVLSKSKPVKRKNKKQIWKPTIAIACYTQNCSLIRLHHGKTTYELLHDRKPDLSYLYVFGALCYPTNDIEDLGKLKAKADVDFDELTTMASEQSSSRPALREMSPGTLSSGLVPQPPSSTPFFPPTRDDWDTLLQLFFDQYLNPPPCVDPQVFAVIDLEPVVSTGTPSSTTVDYDAPTPSTSQTPQAFPSPVIPPDAEEPCHDIKVAHMDNIPQLGIPIPEILKNLLLRLLFYITCTQSFNHLNTSVNGPKIIRLIEAMQEELNEFECLKVWELIPRPYCVMIITLKWIYKVKLDELGGVLKKAQLVARGYRQEEGIDFEESFFQLHDLKSCVSFLHLLLT
nr:integrase, catalytic region, zinc finger, CCHC-type, peptidase aspartic, catalytic [Tanacetum cinerariifolium]